MKKLIALILCALFALSCTACAQGGGVYLLETQSDAECSYYRVGADLPRTELSNVGQTLADALAAEWAEYDGMTEQQRLLSSRLFGIVELGADTWAECEKALGISVYDPLGTLDRLDQTGYFGMESADPDRPVPHVMAIADASGDRTLRRIDITAGYRAGSIRVTLSAALCSDGEPYTVQSERIGYAAYEAGAAVTGSGIPVLTVITRTADGTGLPCPTAYWVRENVFYTLRVVGEQADEAELLALLGSLLADI